MSVVSYIGFGSNLGDLSSNLKHARALLTQHPKVEFQRLSRLYRSEPLTPDGEEQPWYLNCVFEISTTLTLHELLHVLKDIERQMGRKQVKRWASRIVDLDILFYGNVVYQDKHVTIPHDELINRKFVLEPLCDLISDFVHPDIELPLCDILKHCDDALITEPLLTTSSDSPVLTFELHA